MNKQRRKEIVNVVSSISIIKERLESILNDEQDSYDNIPENLLDSERANQSEEAIEILEEAIDSIDEVIDTLSEI